MCSVKGIDKYQNDKKIKNKNPNLDRQIRYIYINTNVNDKRTVLKYFILNIQNTDGRQWNLTNNKRADGSPKGRYQSFHQYWSLECYVNKLGNDLCYNNW